jgi:hypothetical protein
VEPEELERRRTELHRLIRLLPIPRRRPLDSVSHVERSDEAGLRASRTTWTYYARSDGGFGVGSIPERAFIEQARLPSIDAVMEWVWARIIEEFLRAHVLPRSGARHGVDALVVATLGPSVEHDAVLDASRARSDELAELAQGRSVGVQAAVARREDTPPATLASLARRSFSRLFRPHQRPAGIMQNGASLDEIVLRNVLVNPSTPARTLARFGRAAPSLSLWIVQSVASNPSTPATVLRRLADHNAVAIRWTVAGNASTPAVAVGRLARSDDAVTRWFLARHHVVPPHALVEWVAADRSVALCAAHGPNVAILVDSPVQLDTEVRIAAARNPLTAPEVLARWVYALTDGPLQNQLGVELAANPQTPLHACLALVRRAGSAEMARQLLCRRDVTDEIIDAILDGDRSWTNRPARAPYSLFKWSLAAHAIERLVLDPDPDVRAYVAWTGGLEPPLARRLSADASPVVRRAIARNTDVSEDVIRVLVDDPDQEVAEAARNRLKG